ncbi:transmembrane protein 165-like [Daphnia carinata]|uniref:transmembrane protein 165-like n=1 Tax=Daphnia carinata TaxID=120202 RepID=UPI00257BAF71|nr:transmembrane protein 165-like [Daphnia carinata]
MACTSSITQYKCALSFLIIAWLALQTYADKEPHEDSKEDISIEHGKSSKEIKGTEAPLNDLGFAHAFIASLSVIIVSELGDKTFFIAAIMAMRHSRLVVFSGAILALVIMTCISGKFFGWVTVIIPRVYTYWISTALFAIFGLKMLKEGYSMSPNEGQEEFEEVQSDLKKQEDEEKEKETTQLLDEETGGSSVQKTLSVRQRISGYIPKVFLQALTLTFLAEWGDRSQLATIILAAREDIFGVMLGGVLGHGLCTGLAVLGGRMIAQRISVKTVTLVGGVVFLIFAVSALFFDPES